MLYNVGVIFKYLKNASFEALYIEKGGIICRTVTLQLYGN